MEYRRKDTELAIMQLSIVYWPRGHQEDDLYNQVIWHIGNYYSPLMEKDPKTGLLRASIDEHITENDTVIYPFITWEKDFIVGLSYEQTLLGWSEEMMGSDIFEGSGPIIWKIAIPHFRRHPDLRDHFGRNRFGRRKPLNKAPHPLWIRVPTVWSSWTNYDSYTQEMENEDWLLGELDTYKLEECLK